MALLEVAGLRKNFGGLLAVRDVSLAVEKGQIKAVIGPNGAGKTTLFNLIAGSLAPSGGRVVFCGRDLRGRKPFQVASLGMARTFQNIRLFHGMTALENVMVGCHVGTRSGFISSMFALPWVRRQEREIRDKAQQILDFLDISEIADHDALSLSFGQQRGVELARALAVSPQLLLLDEPAAGLNIYETAEVARQICRIREQGVTVLLVEHDMSLVMEISDEICVLSFGEKIAEGEPEMIQKNPEVIRIYLGE